MTPHTELPKTLNDCFITDECDFGVGCTHTHLDYVKVLDLLTQKATEILDAVEKEIIGEYENEVAKILGRTHGFDLDVDEETTQLIRDQFRENQHTKLATLRTQYGVKGNDENS